MSDKESHIHGKDDECELCKLAPLETLCGIVAGETDENGKKECIIMFDTETNEIRLLERLERRFGTERFNKLMDELARLIQEGSQHGKI